MVRRGPAKLRRDASRAIACLAGACRKARVSWPSISAPPGLEEVTADQHPCSLYAVPMVCSSATPLTIDDLIPAQKVSRSGISCLTESARSKSEHVSQLIHRASDLFAELLDPKDASTSPPVFKGRQRDPLPLPALDALQCKKLCPDICGNVDFDVYLRWLNGCIFAINVLYGLGQGSCGVRISECQSQIIKRISCKLDGMFTRCFDGAFMLSDAEAFLDITGQLADGISSSMHADAFDLLDVSGGVNPMPFLDDSAQQVLSDPNVLFADAPNGLDNFTGVRREHTCEYAKLVCRQLVSCKVALVSKVQAGASIFAVGKKDSAKLREVWCGDRVSLAAKRPPKPKHLASPSALLKLECTADSTFLVSKRDGRCLFDQLKAPVPLQRWFGRPSVLVQDLVDNGSLTLAQIRQHYLDKGTLELHHRVFPVSTVFPMGFSWSSYVAQNTMLHVCDAAGLQSGRILSDDLPGPQRTDSAFALATDDVMVFTRTGEASTRKTSRNLDRAFQRHGVIKHSAKDVSAATTATCVGIDVDSGRYLSPHAASLCKVIAAVTHMSSRKTDLLISPLQLAALLGVMQWECQLNRPTYSIFYHVYEFTKSLPDDVPKRLPSQAFQELLMFICLAPCLEADLARPWLNEVVASDASPVFGFGVSSYKCSAGFARSVGRLSVQPGAYAEVDLDIPGAAKRPKLGTPHRIGVHMAQFKAVLSLRAQYKAHSGSLEAAGVSVMLRWLLRTPAKHSSRVAAMIDAKAVLGAVCKGRSSAPTLRLELRRIAALSLAGDWYLNYVYVPSAYNPADAPSRGKSCSGASLRGVRKKAKPLALTVAQRRHRDWCKMFRKTAAYRIGLHGP